MTGHSGRLGSQPHRAPHPASWAAAAAVIVLTLGACASTGATPANSPTPTPVSFGVGGHRATLTGAGSTFVAPFFDLAFAHYHEQNPGVSISYAAVGSGAGISAFSAKQADFGASDVPMTASEQAAAAGGPSGRWMPGLRAVMAGSFQLVICPRKIFAITGPLRCSLCPPGMVRL